MRGVAGRAGPGARAEARLLAQVALACFYLDPDRLDEASAAALAAAEASQDPDVIVAALRTRQLARSGPDGVADRLALADQMTGLGRRCRRPDVTMWGHLWRIDAPMATWHPPRYLFDQVTSLRLYDAVAIGHHQDLVALVARLAGLREHHIGAGAAAPSMAVRSCSCSRTPSMLWAGPTPR